MALVIEVTHDFVSGKADGPDATLVQPSNWNEDHDVSISIDTATVLGRSTAGAGQVEELTLGAGLNIDTGVIAAFGSAPLGAVMDYAGTTAPSKWLLCYGQAISRTTYAAVFAVIATVYGAGNGTTTFNLPDCRGRVAAGKDDMGGSAATRLTNAGTGNPGVDGATLGAGGGVDRHAVTTPQAPAHTHAISGTTAADGAHGHPTRLSERAGTVSGSGGGFAVDNSDVRTNYPAHDSATPDDDLGDQLGMSTTHTHAFSATSTSVGGGEAHPNVQPTIVFNKIMYVGV